MHSGSSACGVGARGGSAAAREARRGVGARAHREVVRAGHGVQPSGKGAADDRREQPLVLIMAQSPARRERAPAPARARAAAAPAAAPLKSIAAS